MPGGGVDLMALKITRQSSSQVFILKYSEFFQQLRIGKMNGT